MGKITNLSIYKDFGVLLIRLAFGFRLIYGSIDNILSFEQMLHFRDFLDSEGFPFPIISAIVSVLLQFLAGICFISGFWTRLFAAFMIANFTIAIIGVHIGDDYLSTAPALHLLVISVFLLFNGAGKWSLDHRIKRKNLNKPEP